jgi:hypothetical protein
MIVDWFVACRFTTIRRVNGENMPWASSMAHAKRMGTTTTACGEAASTMTKLFDVPFPIRGENCPECLAAVAEDQRRRTAGAAHPHERALRWQNRS